jgi:aspartate carbamoyltransferase catalytic subunit
VEIAPEVAEGPCSVITEQVANGVAIRMAVLYSILGTGTLGTASLGTGAPGV